MNKWIEKTIKIRTKIKTVTACNLLIRNPAIQIKTKMSNRREHNKRLLVWVIMIIPIMKNLMEIHKVKWMISKTLKKEISQELLRISSNRTSWTLPRMKILLMRNQVTVIKIMKKTKLKGKMKIVNSHM